MSKRYNQIPPPIHESPAPRPGHRQFDAEPTYSELGAPVRSLSVVTAGPKYLATSSPLTHAPASTPVNGLKVKSIVVRRQEIGPHVADVRIKRIVVKVPPITTYSQVADKLNRE